jgi:hypothetical protein
MASAIFSAIFSAQSGFIFDIPARKATQIAGYDSCGATSKRCHSVPNSFVELPFQWSRHHSYGHPRPANGALDNPAFAVHQPSQWPVCLLLDRTGLAIADTDNVAKRSRTGSIEMAVSFCLPSPLLSDSQCYVHVPLGHPTRGRLLSCSKDFPDIRGLSLGFLLGPYPAADCRVGKNKC